MDGTVGELIRRTDISHMRPAHIHFHLTAPGCHPVMTQLYRSGGRHLDSDVVFGVKEALQPPGPGPNGEHVATPFHLVTYDFVLQRQA